MTSGGIKDTSGRKVFNKRSAVFDDANSIVSGVSDDDGVVAFVKG